MKFRQTDWKEVEGLFSIQTIGEFQEVRSRRCVDISIEGLKICVNVFAQAERQGLGEDSVDYDAATNNEPMMMT